MAIRHLLGLNARHVRNTRPETGMWPALVVVGHPLLEDRPQMPFVQNNEPIHTLSTDRADQPLAKRIRLWQRTGVFSTVRPMAATALWTAAA
jgi:hypothetical protein